MKNIATLDQRDFEPQVDITKRHEYHSRKAARAVVFDDSGAVALLRAKVRNYYKLPGGGIEESEEIHQALAREIKEELGCEAIITDEIGGITEWRDMSKLHQTSFCFKAKLQGSKGIPAFTEEEIAEGFEIVWAPSIAGAIELVMAATNSSDLSVKFMATRDTRILQAAI